MNYNLSLKDNVVDALLLWLNDNYEKIITTDGLVQQTGTSTTAVMSQKAVTDAIATKQDQLTFDPSPLSGSQNPVTSGGIFSAIESAKGAAGLAEALLDTDSEGAEQEFSLRKSGGDGGAYFRRLLGNTKAFNQLVQNGNFASSDGWVFQNANGSISDNAAKFTATARYGMIRCATPNLVPGHIYHIGLSLKFTSNEVHFQVRNNTQSTAIVDNAAINGRNGAIFTYNGLATDSILIRVLDYAVSDWAEIKVEDVILDDLTAMQDNSTTPEEFREKYPLLYYAYGRKLIHNKVAKVITKGANQWDEVWEHKTISTVNGETRTAAPNYISSVNKIKVISGAEYYLKNAHNANQIRVFLYDSAGAFITSEVISSNSTYTIPSGAFYICFQVYYADTYAYDICINLSDAEINGQYFPYWERELSLDITNQEDTDGNKPFADGMMGAGSAVDYANEVGGAKVTGKVKFSDLSWTYDSVNEYFNAEILDMLAPSTNAGRLDGIVCSAYPVDTIAGISLSGTDKTCKRYNSRIYVKDTAYTDAVTFKAAMGDTELVYEKATPVPFTWKEPLNTGIKVSKYGTEEITPAQTENIDNAPFRAVTTYSISVANLIAALSALGNRGGAKGLLGGGNQGENPENEELTPEEESPKEEAPKEEETPVVEPIPEVQNKR